jgi:orotidine-5'-phosphate decarboxylase
MSVKPDLAKAKLIVALDVNTYQEAKRLVDKLYPTVKIFKVGSQLFCGCGPKIITYLSKKGANVFLDLKFYDIPNTVAGAVRQAVRLGVSMMTLHISGGKEMLTAAVKAAYQEARRLRVRRPLLVGVTVLTSKESTPGEVLNLAKEGLQCGLDGVVCSVRETAFLKKKINKKFVIVTPGIRPAGSPAFDQKRTATAQEAIKAGSDFLVAGRPIVEALDPRRAAREFM